MNAPFNPLASRAYGVFLEELSRHLGEVRIRLGRGDPIGSTEARELGERFHTIKGGAGFFGLHEIEQVAAGLEQIFLAPSAEPWPSGWEEHLVKLEALSARVPRPAGGVHA